MGSRNERLQDRLDTIFKALDEGIPAREIDARVHFAETEERGRVSVERAIARIAETEERGRVSVELAILRISAIERVERVVEVPRRSEDDLHGRDLQVFFVNNDPIDCVSVEVKSSPAGVGAFRKRAADHIRLQHGWGNEVDVEVYVDKLYASERRMVLNARAGESIFYRDFSQQLNRIVDYQRTHPSDQDEGDIDRVG